MYFLSIIVPLYNEENLVTEVIRQLEEVRYPDVISEYEIIVVNDCSSDRSAEVVQSFIAGKSHARLVHHEVNQGKGAAVKTGIAAARGNIFLIQDADMELRPQDIPRMIDCMHELGVEFVNGSRYMEGVNRPLSSYKRYLGNKIFTMMTAVLINVKITDMACGYKLIHRHLYDQLSLRENRFGFEAELIIKALRVKRNNIAEVPVHYFPRNEGEGKKLRNSDAFKILWTIVKFGLFRFK